jgi:hypothetical protein
MAKGRKPQFSFDDLQKMAQAMFGGATAPTTNPNQAMAQGINRSNAAYLDPRDFGKPNNLLTDIYDYGNPLPMITAEETRRLINQGGRPDQGHLASLALLGAFLKGNKIVKNAYRGGQAVFREKGVKSPAIRSKQTTATTRTAKDPMAQEVLLSSLVSAMNRR